jgi:uncharacterized protein (DUF169 family)
LFVVDHERKTGATVRDPLREVQAEEIDLVLVPGKRGEIVQPLQAVMEKNGFLKEKASPQTLMCALRMAKSSPRSWVSARI